MGSCLSGGLDSTTIVAFMSELLQENAPDAASLRGQLKTFSAVFDGDPIDEREYIEVAVESTGADTTYTNPTSLEFCVTTMKRVRTRPMSSPGHSP